MNQLIKRIKVVALFIILFFVRDIKSQTCTANFVFSVGANGFVTFTSTSVGTNSGTPYSWNFGNNTFTNAIGASGVVVNTTYTANAIYTVVLYVGSTITPCNSIITKTISVTTSTNSTPCNLNLGTMSIISTSVSNVIGVIHNTTGILPSTTFTYNWGDGNNSIVTSPFPTHSYTSSGTFFVSMQASNNTTPACTYSSNGGGINLCGGTTFDLTISHSVGANGQVSLFSSGVGTTSSTNYTWNINQFNSSVNYQLNTANPTITLPNGIYSYGLFAVNPGCILGIGTNSITFTVTNAPPCTLTPSFNYSLLPNNTTQFYNQSSVSIGNLSGTSYTWTFGDGNNSTTFANSINHAYAFNGTYTVTLAALSPNCGAASISSIVAITNTASTNCLLNANFSYFNNANNLVSFFNTTTGTLSGTSYTWNFGDGGTSTSISPAHTYSNYGNYLVSLTANNNTIFPCVSTKTVLVNVCNLTANFTLTQGQNGVVQFNSTSAGTHSATSYYWYIGNTSVPIIGGPSLSYTFNTNGNFPVKLSVFNNLPLQTCADSIQQNVNINTYTCPLNVSFSHTVGSAGLVNFASTSTGTSALASYTWNFGDGWFSNANNPSHTYMNGGTHFVTLTVKDSINIVCTRTATMALNITGVSCQANANFSLVPTATAQYWNALLAYPYNITSAVWSWGDGSSSNVLYASHQYSASGNYSICLSVTASCGSTATACSTYSVYKGSGSPAQIIYVRVVPSNPEFETGILENQQNLHFEIYPNPNHGQFSIEFANTSNSTVSLELIDMLGNSVYQNNALMNSNHKQIDVNLENIPSGIYFVKVVSSEHQLTKKLIITK